MRIYSLILSSELFGIYLTILLTYCLTGLLSTEFLLLRILVLFLHYFQNVLKRNIVKKRYYTWSMQKLININRCKYIWDILQDTLYRININYWRKTKYKGTTRHPPLPILFCYPLQINDQYCYLIFSGTYIREFHNFGYFHEIEYLQNIFKCVVHNNGSFVRFLRGTLAG